MKWKQKLFNTHMTRWVSTMSHTNHFLSIPLLLHSFESFQYPHFDYKSVSIWFRSNCLNYTCSIRKWKSSPDIFQHTLAVLDIRLLAPVDRYIFLNWKRPGTASKWPKMNSAMNLSRFIAKFFGTSEKYYLRVDATFQSLWISWH